MNLAPRESIQAGANLIDGVPQLRPSPHPDPLPEGEGEMSEALVPVNLNGSLRFENRD